MKKEKNQLSRFLKREVAPEVAAKDPSSFKMEPYPSIPAPAMSASLFERCEDKRSVQKPLCVSKGVSKNPNLPPKTCAVADKLKYSQNGKTALVLLEKHFFFKRRITNVQVKERLLAFKRLKQLGQQTQHWIEYRIHQKVFYQKENQTENISETLFRQSQEERHFVIERIIRYLADI